MNILIEAATVVKVLHDNKIIHKHIKPANLLALGLIDNITKFQILMTFAK